MLSAGLDVGAENIKAAIMDDHRLVSFAAVPCGWDTGAAAAEALDAALRRAGIGRDDLKGIGATGMGRETVKFATRSCTEAAASGRGVSVFYPAARTVIDIGAEQSQAFTCDAAGRVLEYTRNDQCAAGAGAFLEAMAAVLELDVSALSDTAAQATGDVKLNATCAIFAESEVVSLLSEGTGYADVARAVCHAIAGRAATLLRTVMAAPDIVFIGGVARIPCVVEALSEKAGFPLTVPDEPRALTAAGAALLAQEAAS